MGQVGNLSYQSSARVRGARNSRDMVRCAKDIVGNLSPSNVRQYCQQYFSVERMVADYVALYQRIAAEDNPLHKSTDQITMVA